MNTHIDFTKNYSSLPGEELTLEARFRTFFNITKDCGIAFNNALIMTEGVSLKMACEVYQKLEKEGFPSDELSIGLISSRVLDEEDILSLLWWKRFNFFDCSTAMIYYGSKSLMIKIINRARKWGYTKDLHRIALHAGGDDLPASEFMAEVVRPYNGPRPPVFN